MSAWRSVKSFAARIGRKVKSIFKRGEPAAPQPPQPPAFAPEQVANPLFSGTETTPGNIYQKGDWTLFVYYRNRGTRSQGQHGILIHNGQEVLPKQPGEIIQTDLGELKYYKTPEEISVLWDMTGWNFTGT